MSDSWWKLVVGVVIALVSGGLSTLGGYVSQRRSEASAAARDDRAREHEAEVWARDRRFDAHVKYLAAVEGTNRRLDDLERQHGTLMEAFQGAPPDNYLSPLWYDYQAVRLVCTSEAADAAHKVFEALFDYLYSSGPEAAIEWARDQYVASVRREFRMPPPNPGTFD